MMFKLLFLFLFVAVPGVAMLFAASRLWAKLQPKVEKAGGWSNYLESLPLYQQIVLVMVLFATSGVLLIYFVMSVLKYFLDITKTWSLWY